MQMRNKQCDYASSTFLAQGTFCHQHFMPSEVIIHLEEGCGKWSAILGGSSPASNKTLVTDLQIKRLSKRDQG